jgi:hypothetical protein
MIITMVLMGMVEVAVHKVVKMITVWYFFMTAGISMYMIFIV